MKPFPYQQTGIEFLASRTRAALLDEPGLGKTAQAIEALGRVGAKRTLLIVPLIVIANWERELEMWAPWLSTQRLRNGRDKVDADASVVLCPHSLVAREKILLQLTEQRWDVVIVDEAHYFKNPKAARTQALYARATGIAPHAERLWLLTGTLIPNNASEVWTHLTQLAPESITYNGRLMQPWQFEQRYCEYEETRFGKRITGNRNADELRDILSTCTLGRRKADVLPDLPTSRSTCVTLPAPTRKQLKPMEDLLDRISEETGRNVRELSGADLLQAVRDSSEFSTYRRLSGEIKTEAAIEWLTGELESGLEKVVVFAHHIGIIQQLTEALSSYGAQAITGDVSADGRQRIVDQFQTDPECRVVIGQLTAASTGITLTAASDVVFVETDWTPGTNKQASDRVHRVGQTKPVLVRHLTMEGSVDELVTSAIMRKTRMISELDTTC
ncbi:MAG: DEAD/DEAH box helicase [Ilumatobacteraceae bacterium]